jgi:transposase
MVVIGIDAHKRTYTAVAVDALGRQLDALTVLSTSDGHIALVEWASAWEERVFALEDCRHLTRRLERDLLRAGEEVRRVPTRLMAGARRSARTPGKSDPIDALAAARAALREPDLPTARLDGPARELRLLVDHRDDLVAERTRLANRLRWHLHELLPALAIPPKGLRRWRYLDEAQAALRPLEGTIAEIARELLVRAREITGRVNELERQITRLVGRLSPELLAIPGCGALTAAKIVGETAGASRFRSKAAFARFNGTAPIPVWSSNTERHRLNRGGNRQLNAALHRIAITQLRGLGGGRQYVEGRLASGSTQAEAIRLLRRRLSDVVFRALLADERARMLRRAPLASSA